MSTYSFARWRKASFSGNQGGNCVEVAPAVDGSAVGVRDSKSPSTGPLAFNQQAWIRFSSEIGGRAID